jgi:hypothetical protein
MIEGRGEALQRSVKALGQIWGQGRGQGHWAAHSKLFGSSRGAHAAISRKTGAGVNANTESCPQDNRFRLSFQAISEQICGGAI